MQSLAFGEGVPQKTKARTKFDIERHLFVMLVAIVPVSEKSFATQKRNLDLGARNSHLFNRL